MKEGVEENCAAKPFDDYTHTKYCTYLQYTCVAAANRIAKKYWSGIFWSDCCRQIGFPSLRFSSFFHRFQFDPTFYYSANEKRIKSDISSFQRRSENIIFQFVAKW